MLREVLQSLGECNSGAANNSFTATIDPLEGREVKCTKEVGALLEVSGKLSKQKVGCERNFDGLFETNNSQMNITWNTMYHKPFLRSDEGIAMGLREWQMRERVAARRHTRVE